MKRVYNNKNCVIIAKPAQSSTYGARHLGQFIQDESRRERGPGTAVKEAPFSISSISLHYAGMKKGRGDPREDSGKNLRGFLLIH